MNDLKLINLEKLKKSLTLFIYFVLFAFTACTQKQELIPLPSTYITAAESKSRIVWFKKHKWPVLDALTRRQEGQPENEKLDFENLDSAINFFEQLIKNSTVKDTVTGVRAYFASTSTNPGKCGKLTLIFTATYGKNNMDRQNYYAFKNGIIDTISSKNAREWVGNYQLIKRDSLSRKTMSANDSSKETKHILFSIEKINEIIKEMKYQKITHSKIVKGFGIRFTSYTDKDYKFQETVIKHHQRLTIGFTFINKKKKDIGIEDIDPVEFKKRLQLGFRSDTMDTGDPTPPPPTNNKEELDISNQ